MGTTPKRAAHVKFLVPQSAEEHQLSTMKDEKEFYRVVLPILWKYHISGDENLDNSGWRMIYFYVRGVNNLKNRVFAHRNLSSPKTFISPTEIDNDDMITNCQQCWLHVTSLLDKTNFRKKSSQLKSLIEIVSITRSMERGFLNSLERKIFDHQFEHLTDLF